ncbi:MAG: FAD-binding protein [Caulobacteraceae bacterium]|nr:FAD-binding protein [Caulobacteraceae bacterium]
MAAEEQRRHDLVVVGFGAAGASAAIRARDLGGSVLIVEKQPQQTHAPNTMLSGGVIMAVNDAERGAPYMDACAGGFVPMEVTRAWAKRAEGLMAWLRSIGAASDYTRSDGGEHVGIPGADAIDVWVSGSRREDSVVDQAAKSAASAAMNATSQAARGGRELWVELAAAVHARGVEVEWAARAERLIQDETGGVVGVAVLAGDGRRREFRARKGVVLACGGYEFDEDMKRQFLKAAPMHFFGGVGHTGDGVRMAQKAGASLWHMNLAVGRAIGHFPLGDGTYLNATPRIAPGGYVITDKHGRRFANEFPQAQLSHAFLNELTYFDAQANDYPRIPAYWICDSRRIKAGPLVSPSARYPWSADNAAEIESGWIKAGPTVEAAAHAAGVLDPKAAAAEVARYNAACSAGADSFGRPAETLTPLDAGPFYCIPLYPGGSNTSGGPRRDERARILDAFGEPIPGLYGAGELGQAVGSLYPAWGANLGEAFCFGQIAAEDALGKP